MSKRGNNEGCISKRKDGRYVAVITTGFSSDGKQMRKCFYGKTRSEVAEKLKIAQITQTNPASNDYRLLDWLEYWMEQYVINKVRQSTRVSYDLFIHKHIANRLGNMPLSSLKGNDLQKFFNDLLANGKLDGSGGLGPKTIRNIYNMIHSSLETALNNDLIMKNPCRSVVLPSVHKREISVLSVEEEKKLLEAAATENLGVGVILVLATGLRLGELLGLTWSSINLENGFLTVKQALNRLKSFDSGESKTSIVIGETKSRKSRRQIPLLPYIVDQLKQYKLLQEKHKAFVGEAYTDQDFVIANELGKPIEPRTYQDFFKRLLHKAGLRDINFHALRHTFATRCLENGLPAKVVSEYLGHANISITLDTYSHVTNDFKANEIKNIANLFPSPHSDK